MAEPAFAPYYVPDINDPVRQGDIFWACPLATPLKWCVTSDELGEIERSSPDAVVELNVQTRGIVLTQACDLEKKNKSNEPLVTNVVLAPVEPADLFEKDLPNIKRGRQPGLHYLPATRPCLDDAYFPASVVDYRRLHTVKRSLLDALCQQRQRKVSIGLFYREVVSAAMALCYARMGLPEGACEEQYIITYPVSSRIPMRWRPYRASPDPRE